jgi:hypothetical protein
MCFVRAWDTGFDDKYLAPRLSHHNQVAGGAFTPNSSKSDCIHIISAVAFATALYSAFVLDLETVACFFAHHEIRFGPKKTAKPPVDLLSSRQWPNLHYKMH